VRRAVTFDAYGTLIDFRLSDAVRQVLADRLPMEGVDSEEFIDDFRVMRFQAVLEPYRAYCGINRYGRPGSSLYRPYDELSDLSAVSALPGEARAS
jgi:hypothetical protein